MKRSRLVLIMLCMILLNLSIASAITITPRISKDNYQIFMFSILGITDVTLSVTTEKLAFTNLHLQLSEEFANISLKVEKLDGPPEGLGAPGGAYQHIRVINSKIRDATVDFLIIEFRVKKSWLSENGIKDSDVILTRYTYSYSWVELPTSKIAESIEYIYYEAKSPGFDYLSYFSIFAKRPVEQMTMQKPNSTAILQSINYSSGSSVANETAMVVEYKTQENKTPIQKLLGMIYAIFGRK